VNSELMLALRALRLVLSLITVTHDASHNAGEALTHRSSKGCQLSSTCAEDMLITPSTT